MIQLPQIQLKASVHLYFLFFRAVKTRTTAPGRRLRRIASFTDFFVCQLVDHLSEGVLDAFGLSNLSLLLARGGTCFRRRPFPSDTTQTKPPHYAENQIKHGEVRGWEKGQQQERERSREQTTSWFRRSTKTRSLCALAPLKVRASISKFFSSSSLFKSCSSLSHSPVLLHLTQIPFVSCIR
jgi:hypothetical protein